MRYLIVCQANATRSAVCESILKKMLDDAGIEDVEVASAGLMDFGDNPMPRDPVMARIAAEHGYEMGGMSVHLTKELADSADIVLVMSPSMREKVTRVMNFGLWDRIFSFREYALNEDGGVTDPTGGAEHMYRNTFDKIEAGCTAIVERLRKQRNLE